MCGDHRSMVSSTNDSMGSPPHVRGPPCRSGKYLDEAGITPACAGTTYLPLLIDMFDRDHPRMCGDHRSIK